MTTNTDYTREGFISAMQRIAAVQSQPAAFAVSQLRDVDNAIEAALTVRDSLEGAAWHSNEAHVVTVLSHFITATHAINSQFACLDAFDVGHRALVAVLELVCTNIAHAYPVTPTSEDVAAQGGV